MAHPEGKRKSDAVPHDGGDAAVEDILWETAQVARGRPLALRKTSREFEVFCGLQFRRRMGDRIGRGRRNLCSTFVRIFIVFLLRMLPAESMAKPA